jgi:hypothetical protein
MSENDNPHTVRYQCYLLVYWQYSEDHGGSVACGVNDKWTTCSVEGFGHYPTMTFTPEQIHERDKLLAFMDKAYERGRVDAKREIRVVLGIVP